MESVDNLGIMYSSIKHININKTNKERKVISNVYTIIVSLNVMPVIYIKHIRSVLFRILMSYNPKLVIHYKT